MSTAALSAPDTHAGVSIDRLFLALALIATAILVALVLLDGQPASAALILGGFGLGIAFLKAEFSYTASWRRFLTRGEAGGLLGGLIVIAITALAVVPVAALKNDRGTRDLRHSRPCPPSRHRPPTSAACRDGRARCRGRGGGGDPGPCRARGQIG